MCHRVLHTYCARLAHGIGREAFRDVSDVVYVVHMYGVSEVTSGEAGGEADQAGLSRVLTFGCRWRVRPGTDLLSRCCCSVLSIVGRNPMYSGHFEPEWRRDMSCVKPPSRHGFQAILSNSVWLFVQPLGRRHQTGETVLIRRHR